MTKQERMKSLIGKKVEVSLSHKYNLYAVVKEVNTDGEEVVLTNEAQLLYIYTKDIIFIRTNIKQ